MVDVAHLDDDVVGVEFALAVRQAQIGDVRRIGGEDARHFGERAGFVEDDDAQSRSEEHTSELQSLMRISYAVFCLKKKITNKVRAYNHTMKNSIISTVQGITS